MKNKIIEALIYIQGDEGLSSVQLQNVMKLNTPAEARKLLHDFKAYFNNLDRGIFVVEFNDIFKFATIEEVKNEIISLTNTTRKQKLTNSAIETVAIIAYKQPVTRSMINDIRGVNSDHIFTTLLLKGLIQEAGVASTPGNPILYEITNKFYDYFKIKSLQELPKFKEIENLAVANLESDDSIEELDFDLYSSQREEE